MQNFISAEAATQDLDLLLADEVDYVFFLDHVLQAVEVLDPLVLVAEEE